MRPRHADRSKQIAHGLDDPLVQRILRRLPKVMVALAAMFEDAEDMVAEAAALAEQKAQVFQADGSRLKSEIGELTKQGRDYPSC